MLQRIQTIFLLLASACMLVAVVTPLARFTYQGDTVVFEAMGMYKSDNLTDSTWGLFVLGIISSIASLITVFLYKQRVLQIRLSVMNIVVMVGFYLFFGYLIYSANSTATLTFQKVGIGLIMPIVGIILTYLAIRRIAADEALVRSLNRLRK